MDTDEGASLRTQAWVTTTRSAFAKPVEPSWRQHTPARLNRYSIDSQSIPISMKRDCRSSQGDRHWRIALALLRIASDRRRSEGSCTDGHGWERLLRHSMLDWLEHHREMVLVEEDKSKDEPGLGNEESPCVVLRLARDVLRLRGSRT